MLMKSDFAALDGSQVSANQSCAILEFQNIELYCTVLYCLAMYWVTVQCDVPLPLPPNQCKKLPNQTAGFALSKLFRTMRIVMVVVVVIMIRMVVMMVIVMVVMMVMARLK